MHNLTHNWMHVTFNIMIHCFQTFYVYNVEPNSRDISIIFFQITPHHPISSKQNHVTLSNPYLILF